MKTRTIELLRKLVSRRYPISIKQLASTFDVSPRTINNDIVEANEFLLHKGLSEIVTVHQKGIVLDLSDEERTNLIEALKQLEMTYLTREERSFDLLLALAFSGKPIYLYQQEEVYLISKSTMDEDMRRLRAEVQEYGIELISIRKQGLVLKGLERSIRTMLYDWINRQVGVIDGSEGRDEQLSISKKILYRYLPKQEFESVDAIYQQKLRHFDDNFYKNQIVLFTLIWIHRLQLNESLLFSNITQQETEDQMLGHFIDRIAEAFQLQPSIAERDYIASTIETFNGKDINNSLEWVQAQLLSIQLVQFVEAETKIPFSQKEWTLYEALYKHLAGLINRLKNNIQITNPLMTNIKKNYGAIYQAVCQYIPVIEEVVGKKISEDEVAFLVIHFSTIASSLKQDIQLIYKCVVICNHGFATGNLLAENLKEKYPEIQIVAVLSSKDLEVIDRLDVDLVFSTYSLVMHAKPTLVTSPIINKENQGMIRHFLDTNSQYQRLEIKKKDQTSLFNDVLQMIDKSGGKVSRAIYQELEESFEAHQLTINKREIQPMLKDLLFDNHILINKNASDWKEAIESVALPLLKEEAIEEKYVDAMIGAVNEFGPYIVIGKHLALAHARPEDGVNKLGISVATMEQPVNFGNEELDPVKIIFCLAATDSYAHLNIMKELVELIHDEEKLTRLIASPNVEAFKTILFK
ncbi:BglG family transcription antiterminator [Enterococcus sp. LJL98]